MIYYITIKIILYNLNNNKNNMYVQIHGKLHKVRINKGNNNVSNIGRKIDNIFSITKSQIPHPYLYTYKKQ